MKVFPFPQKGISEEERNVRRLIVMIMDNERHSDEEVLEALKSADLDDALDYSNVVRDLKLYRPFLWIKLEKESPLFHKRP